MTCHHKEVVDGTTASNVFDYLRDNIRWIDGVKSKKGFTRKACPMRFGDDHILDVTISDVFEKLKIPIEKLQFIYLNYYRDGDDWCPNHTHPGTQQVIISLGATRTLRVGTKDYPLNHGDVIVFGASLHGVVKDPQCKEGRIAIAMFLDK